MLFLKEFIALCAEDIAANEYLQVIEYYFSEAEKIRYFTWREINERQPVDHHFWLDKYQEIVFFQLFRMSRGTFDSLLKVVIKNDRHKIITRNYRGGRHPVEPEKALLIFLRYMASQETLHSLGDRFNIVPATVMKIVNCFLYVIVSLKNVYIQWPKSQEEFDFIINRFQNYPGTVGAVDGSHIKLKVPMNQHDSYVDRYQSHSINLMGICTYDRIFTYVFIGYPGSAHDSRVFSNSQLVKNIERWGKEKYFPRDNYHIIGDSAFPLKTWLMTPYSRNHNLTAVQKYHNRKLSADRVRIENTFSAVKLRWARLKFINTYCISKAVEINTAACVLHNFCYLLKDEWPENDIQDHNDDQYELNEHHGEAYILGQIKRDEIAQSLRR